MKIKVLLPAIALAAAVLAQGCVSNKKYAALQADYSKLQDTNRNLNQSYQVTQQELAGSRSQVAGLQDQIAQAKANALALQDELSKCLAGNNQGNVNISKPDKCFGQIHSAPG
jgi:chemotaxis protein MotB